MRITIIGGCLTQQGNIPPAALYHQQLLRALAAAGTEASLSVVRYERLATCLADVRARVASQPVDWFIFHLRTEPLLRLTKLLYRYHDGACVRYRLNVGRTVGAARHDPLRDRPRPAAGAVVTDYRSPPPRRLGPELNAWLGTVLGNRRRAVLTTFHLLADLHALAVAVNARLLIVGPPARPASFAEGNLARLLHRQAERWTAARAIDYLPLLDEQRCGSTSFFESNLVHVSAAGHARLAELLFARLQPTPQGPVVNLALGA